MFDIGTYPIPLDMLAPPQTTGLLKAMKWLVDETEVDMTVDEIAT